MINQNQTPINPNAFTNQGNINGMFGQEMPGTFNRQVDPATGYPLDQNVNPMANQNTMQPVPSPIGVDPDNNPYTI